MILLCSLTNAGTVDGLYGWTGPGAPITQAQPAGDLDGDGQGDIALGVPLDADVAQTGAVYIVTDVLGTNGLSARDAGVRLAGERADDEAGAWLVAPGDLDGDGYDDLAVSAPEATVSTAAEGKVYLIYGEGSIADGSLADRPSVVGKDTFERVGSRVFVSPDLNDDGRPELLFGTPYSSLTDDPGVPWLALLHGDRYTGQVELGVELGTPGTTTGDAGWLVVSAHSFFGRAAAVSAGRLIVSAPALDHGEEIEEEKLVELPGSVYIFDADVAPGAVMTEDDAIARIDGTGNLQLAWILASDPGGALLAAVPNEGAAAGAVLQLDPEISGTAEYATNVLARWSGDNPGDLMGMGMAPFNADGALFVAGEPGWDAGRGRFRVWGQDGEIASFEGCTPDDELGSSVLAGPGPDPEGGDDAWVGITGPGSGLWGDGTGSAWILRAGDEPGTDCPPGEQPLDADEDGWGPDEDCDDAAPWRYPGAREVCGDNVDDDCDGAADESCIPEVATCGCEGQGAWLIALLFVPRRRR